MCGVRNFFARTVLTALTARAAWTALTELIARYRVDFTAAKTAQTALCAC